MRVGSMVLLALLGACKAEGEEAAQRACYELADTNCTRNASCGDDKYACMVGYISSLPCHEAKEIADEDALATCLEQLPLTECDAERPSACSNLIVH